MNQRIFIALSCAAACATATGGAATYSLTRSVTGGGGVVAQGVAIPGYQVNATAGQVVAGARAADDRDELWSGFWNGDRYEALRALYCHYSDGTASFAWIGTPDHPIQWQFTRDFVTWSRPEGGIMDSDGYFYLDFPEEYSLLFARITAADD